ncbi:MAG TPA: MBL fold metallo-hydrolase, partial [Candidatus Polarisedimenticolaceae bacterium]|nr:MBL fold metallo-hydrolase [Candidatus Polarisedimenticolaceae bacterium]
MPSPFADRLRYGGNTSCLALPLDDDHHLIFDCGSGLREFGNSLAARPAGRARRFHVFFSHYHFDHVEGLPLFLPLYDSQSEFAFYGFRSGERSIREILEALIRPPYFPVTLAGVPAKTRYVDIGDEPVAIGDIAVNSLPLNHPDGCLAFRLERGDRRIVYATDHEHGNPEADRALIDFARASSHLIYDATYTPTEYEESRRGWGHSTWYAAVQIAIAARVEN